MFQIKNMSVGDFAFAVRLTDTMNWNLLEEDFKFMVGLEPDGCFVVFDGSERIGLATVTSFGQVAWMGNVIVSENHREKGVGSLLVRHSIEYLLNKHVRTIGLYSYITEIPFYNTFGFKYDSDFVVLEGEEFSVPTCTYLRDARMTDLKWIVDLDRLCFGSSRRKLLEPILLNPNNLCYVYFEDGRMVAFIMVKGGQQIAEVGPLVCPRQRGDIAENILKRALSMLDGVQVLMYIPEKESEIITMLTGYGFKETFRVARMFYGRPVVNDFIYLSESLERG